MHDQRGQRAAQRTESQVAGGQVLAGDEQQALGHGFQVTGQGALQHQLAGLYHLGGEVQVAAAGVAPEAGQGCLTGGVVLQQRQLIHELVAGGAIHPPIARQGFAGAEDLFHIDGQVAVRTQAVDAPAQSPAVSAGVGQAVHMVDAQAIDQAFLDQREKRAMDGLEDLGAFDPQAAQFVDVEEAPPVDVVRGGAPAGQAVMLALQQRVQPLEAFLAIHAVRVHAPLQGHAHLGRLAQLAQFLAQPEGAVPAPLATRQAGEAHGQRAQPDMACMSQDARAGRRCQGKTVFMVGDVELPGVFLVAEDQLSGAQHLGIVAAQEGHQQLTAQQRVVGAPLDIEELGVGAGFAPFQHVEPPGVAVAADRHVVGDDVQDQTHAVRVQRIHQPAQRLFTAQFRVDAGRVQHVVTVQRAGSGGEQWRGIDMADAQRGEVGHPPSGVVQGEAPVELQAQGGEQRTHGREPACRLLSRRRRRAMACGSRSRRSTLTGQRRRQLGW